MRTFGGGVFDTANFKMGRAIKHKYLASPAHSMELNLEYHTGSRDKA